MSWAHLKLCQNVVQDGQKVCTLVCVFGSRVGPGRRRCQVQPSRPQQHPGSAALGLKREGLCAIRSGWAGRPCGLAALQHKGKEGQQHRLQQLHKEAVAGSSQQVAYLLSETLLAVRPDRNLVPHINLP